MSDLISREDAKRIIDNIDTFCAGWRDYTKKQIDNLSTAKKVGKWIIHTEVKNIYGGTYIECSECRNKYVVQHIEDEKFCRNCGAYMRGEEDE